MFVATLALFFWTTRTAPAQFSLEGCTRVDGGGVCEMERAGVLRVRVVAHKDASATVRVDGATREAIVAPADDGVVVSVDIPPGARSVRVAVADVDGRRHAEVPVSCR
jgi:hypothetical protein